MSLHFARIYGELAVDFMRAAGDSENAANRRITVRKVRGRDAVRVEVLPDQHV